MSAYLISQPRRAIHVGVWVKVTPHFLRLVPACTQGNAVALWWPVDDAEIATRRMCSRCVAVVKQMTTLIEQATT